VTRSKGPAVRGGAAPRSPANAGRAAKLVLASGLRGAESLSFGPRQNCLDDLVLCLCKTSDSCRKTMTLILGTTETVASRCVC